MSPRDLSRCEGQRAEVSTINDGSDELLLDNNIATRRNDTVAQKSIKNVLTENNDLLVTILDSIISGQMPTKALSVRVQCLQPEQIMGTRFRQLPGMYLQGLEEKMDRFTRDLILAV